MSTAITSPNCESHGPLTGKKPKFRVRRGLHQQNDADGVERTYSARSGKVFETDAKVVLDDPIKYERLLDDGRPMNSPDINIPPTKQRPGESDQDYAARMLSLAQECAALASKVNQTPSDGVKTIEQQKQEQAKANAPKVPVNMPILDNPNTTEKELRELAAADGIDLIGAKSKKEIVERIKKFYNAE